MREQHDRVSRCLVFIERYLPSDGAWAPVGTGFTIGSSGEFVTARHNIDPAFQDNYSGTFRGVTYHIRRVEGFDYTRVGADIVVYKLSTRAPNEVPAHVRLDAIEDRKLVGEPVSILGYFSKDRQVKYTEAVVSSVQNGVLHLQGGNPGLGFSGAPVVRRDSGALVGVVSQRDPDSGFCFATSVNILLSMLPESAPRSEGWQPPVADYESTAAYDRAIYRLLRRHKEQYLKAGDPVAQFALLEPHLFLFGRSPPQHSLQLARLHEFAAYLLINAQRSTETLEQARRLLSETQNILRRLDFFGDDLVRTQVRTTWLTAITYRQQGNLEAAYKVCEANVRECESVAPFELVVPLLREMAVIEQNEGAFRQILRDDFEYAGNFMEVFHTHRRYFEYLIRKRALGRAQRILPKVQSSFARVQSVTDAVYVATFHKDLYMYSRLMGELSDARRYYRLAFQRTRKLSLYGQLGSLLSIKRELDEQGYPDFVGRGGAAARPRSRSAAA